MDCVWQIESPLYFWHNIPADQAVAAHSQGYRIRLVTMFDCSAFVYNSGVDNQTNLF